jgi:P-type Ca2+ transporter type 2C
MPPAAGRPWAADAAAVVEHLGGHAGLGLSAAEAAARLVAHGSNELEPEPPVPAWRRLAAQFRSPLVALLLVAVTVSLVVWVVEGAGGVPVDAVAISAILVANAVLGLAQEARAERAVGALQRLAAPTAAVVREGTTVRVPAVDVVPGDLLLLSEGDAVAADARLLEAATLKVNEAALTGESEPVLKDTAARPVEAGLADRRDMVFAGTAVATGRGRAIVTATGMDTEVGRIARLLARTPEDPTPLQREIAVIGRALGLAVVAIVVVVVATIFTTSDVETAGDAVDVLLVGVSLAVAAVPEGLPAVLSVVLALGVQRMARRHAIVKKLSSVETLGSASVICADKTGTLTRGEMTVTAVVTGSGEVNVTGTGYRPDGEATVDGRPLDEDLHDARLADEVRAVVTAGSVANDAVLRPDRDDWLVQGDPTDIALLVAEAKLDAPGAGRERFTRVGEAPFTADRKLMSVVVIDRERDGHAAIVVKGAPDVLLARCAGERVGGTEHPLTAGRRVTITRGIERLAGGGLRTLGVAYRRLPATATADALASAADGDAVAALEHDLVYLGTVGIIDPPRPEAPLAIAEARRAGVRLVMITGDHPRTAARIAADLGIADDGSPTLTGPEIDGLDDDDLRRAVRRVPVYARVTPEHKLRIVDALQADGGIVAMTGDGVNDGPALRSADIGVALGVAGTDVAKEAADMILADDNVATIVAAVREGRAIVANIRRFLRYLLSSNAGEVLTMFLGVVGAGVLGLDVAGEGLVVPLLATQILWINLLTDTGPALALGVDPPPADVMARPPRRPTDRIIDAAMLRGVGLVGLVMSVVTLAALDLRMPGGIVGDGGSVSEGRTMAFTTLVLAQLWNCLNARSDRTSAFHGLFTNRWLWTALAGSLALQIAVVEVPALNEAFDTTPLTPVEWVLCATLASVVLWVGELRKLIARTREPA